MPPTPAGGITAPVVYVRSGTAADFNAVGDVRGKLVLIDSRMGAGAWNMPAFEAGYRHAAGVVSTFTPEDPKYFSVDERALGSFDGMYDLSAPPWIYINRRDGDWLKSRIMDGPVMATMVLKQKITLARDGGAAYNVVGELPGSRADGQMVLMAAHQDAHFRAGMDDTGALANMLTVAKAMCMSGYRPQHTVVFLATCGEEFGRADAYYDWLIGAWWAIGRAHADWAGRIRAMLNLETMAQKGAVLTMRANPELTPWLKRLGRVFPELLPCGFEVTTPISSWNDQWPFTAAGISSVMLHTTNEEYDRLYHSDFETADRIDWRYLSSIAKLVFRAAKQLDDGLLPCSIAARADDIEAALDRNDLLAAGADVSAVSRLTAAVTAFKTVAGEAATAAGSAPTTRIPTANERLLAIEKIINSSMTALSPQDDTLYPHQQVLRDTQCINDAIAALRRAPPDPAAAQKALAGTYLTTLGLQFSYPVYQQQLARLAPGHPHLNWGEQGKLVEPLDVMKEYRQIEAGEIAAAIAGLENLRRRQLDQLDRRLTRMADAIEEATTLTRALWAP